MMVPGIVYRYIIYGLSWIGGRLFRFFSTGWRPLVLWLIVSIGIALVFMQVTAPAQAILPNQFSPLSSIDANNTTQGNLTLAAAQQPLAALSANQSPWYALVNTTTSVFFGGARSFATRMNTSAIALTFIIFVFGSIAYTGYRSRRQILIGEFKDHMETKSDGKQPLGKFPQGTSTLLTGELHRLRSLYTEVDERRAIASIGGRSGQLDYTIQAGDAGEMIKNAISTENVFFEFGPIKVPIGAVAGVFSRFFSGPYITGGFHRDGDLIILDAFMSGAPSRSWRVEGRIVTETDLQVDTGVQTLPLSSNKISIRLLMDSKGEIDNIDQMIRELSCRIFTDLTSGGTTKWRATYFFTEGLKDYRSCLLSRKNQLRNLKNAERRFLEAVSEDSTFDIAWYNLGVVYTELNHLDAAEQAFLKAVEMTPGNWQPYYALALNRFNRFLPAQGYIGLSDHTKIDEACLRDVIHPCEQAVTLNPDNPHLHILIGVCYRILSLKKREHEISLKDPSELYRDCIRTAYYHHRIAARNAWYALCSYELLHADAISTRLTNLQKASVTALWDLARTFFADAMCFGTCSPTENHVLPHVHSSLSVIPSAFRQALLVMQDNAVVLKSLGVVHYHRKDYKKASLALESATQVDPDNYKLWMLFAIFAEKAGYKSKREFAIGKILECPSCMQSDLSPHWRDEFEAVLCRQGGYPALCQIFSFQKEPNQEEFPYDIAWLDSSRFYSVWLEFKNSLENNGISLMEMTPAQKGTLARLSYHHANHNYYSDEQVRIYKEALELLKSVEPGLPLSWIKGFIAYKLASECSSPEYYRDSYYSLRGFPLEIKKWMIDLGYINLLLDEGEIHNALNLASEATHKNPIGFSQLNAFGRCLIKNQDYSKALFAFESALLLEPYDLNTLENIGYCYWMLGNYCQTRKEKENFWKQAIQYYEDAYVALGEKEHQESQDYFSIIYGPDRKSIPYALGCLSLHLSKYGNAVSYFNRASELSRDLSEYYPGEDRHLCMLMGAEALFHKRDHYLSEQYFEIIIDDFKKRITDYPTSSDGIPLEHPEEAVLLAPSNCQLEEVPYAGEIYIRALLGLAYSYAERDAGLNEAGDNVKEAERILGFMKERLQQVRSELDKETDPERIKENMPKGKRVKLFLGNSVPLLTAELCDRKGWIIFKQRSENSLEMAEKEIIKALSIKSDADYHFHLAYICEAMSRETPEKETYIRLARKHCDHVQDMAPRKNLDDSVVEFMKTINDSSIKS